MPTGQSSQKSAARRGAPHGKLLLLFMLLAAVAGCAHAQPTLVVTVGGLGFSQMHDLRMAVIQQCPEAKVISAGMWDAYKADIARIAAAKPHQHIILIGHSFGCEAIDNAAAQLPNVALAVFIDPAWNDFQLSKTIGSYLWFKRSDFGLEREAHILGASKPQVVRGSHNDIPHSPELIAQVVAAIKQVESRPARAQANPGNSGNRALASGNHFDATD